MTSDQGKHCCFGSEPNFFVQPRFNPVFFSSSALYVEKTSILCELAQTPAVDRVPASSHISLWQIDIQKIDSYTGSIIIAYFAIKPLRILGYKGWNLKWTA